MKHLIIPIGSMYGIYANIWDILMVNVTIYIYIAYMDPMGYEKWSESWMAQKSTSFIRRSSDLSGTPRDTSIVHPSFGGFLIETNFPNITKNTFSMLCCLNSWCCFLKSAKRMLTGTFRGNYFKPMISYYFKWTCAILCNRWQFRPMGDDQE